MKLKYVLPRILALLIIIITVASCNEDFETLGTSIVDGQGLNVIEDNTSSVVAYSRKLVPVETNNLGQYQLGIYNDPTYGKSTVNMLSRLNLGQTAPSFGENPVIDSVYLYIPYFSTATATSNEGNTYQLDSVYGESPIKIEVFESNYFLNNLDPASGFEERQLYYSNQGPLFESFLDSQMAITNQCGCIASIDNFIPSEEEIVLTVGEGEDQEIERIEPGLRVALPIDYFTEKILNQEGTSNLESNNNFHNFLRGLYFKVTSTTNEGVLFSFNISDANITINYSFDDTDDEEDMRDEDTFLLNFNGININVFESEFPNDIETALTNTDEINGEENLYLKGGGNGVISIIELFGDTDVMGPNGVQVPNGVPDELDVLRAQNILINEANLIFYVNQSEIDGGETEPERIVIFDLENERYLTDFSLDPTRTITPTINATTEHLGRLERGSDGIGDFYKIRITSHINQLVQRDSTNVRLGLLVSQNVINPNFQDLRVAQSPGINSIPTSSVLSPEGTILYGNASQNEDKRLRLQLFYTDPNQ